MLPIDSVVADKFDNAANTKVCDKQTNKNLAGWV
jgi:hypothetical protein